MTLGRMTETLRTHYSGIWWDITLVKEANTTGIALAQLKRLCFGMIFGSEKVL